jgi:hypothetical protein
MLENYGTHWHLDHITPCCEFNLMEEDQRQQCFYYTNYQPLLCRENKRKAGRKNWSSSLTVQARLVAP